MRAGVTKPAISKLVEGVDLARSMRDLPSLSAYLFILASTLMRLKMTEEAVKYFSECKEVSNTIGAYLLKVVSTALKI